MNVEQMKRSYKILEPENASFQCFCLSSSFRARLRKWFESTRSTAKPLIKFSSSTTALVLHGLTKLLSNSHEFPIFKPRFKPSFSSLNLFCYPSMATLMDQVVYNKPLSYYALRDHVQCIAKELSTVSPLLGFSDLDQFRRILTGSEVLKEDTIQLLWAGKVLDRGKRLSDYIGENEKTKIVMKLQTPDSSPA